MPILPSLTEGTSDYELDGYAEKTVSIAGIDVASTRLDIVLLDEENNG